MRSGALGALLLVSACALPGRRNPEAPVPRQSPSRDTLMTVDRMRGDSLSRLGPVEIMRRAFGDQVVYLHPGAPIVYGGENALTLMRSTSPRLGTVSGWQPMGGGISRDALSGYTYGIAVRSVPEQPAPSIERYLAFWTRPRGGPWRIIAYVEVTPVSPAWPGGMGATGQFPRVTGARRDALRQMLEADSSIAERAAVFGPASAARDAIADDGILLAVPQLLVGPRSASEYYDSRKDLSISWIPRDGFVAASGDLGVTVGESLTTSRGPTGAVTQQFEKYFSVWRRDPGGRWRVVANASNARPSPIGE